MMQPGISDEFDWVTERAKCTPFTVFETLRVQVIEDLKKRNALSGQIGDGKYFTFSSEAQFFAVTYQVPGMNKGVMFIRSENGLDVQSVHPRQVLYQASLFLSNEGRCLLKVGDAEYTFWQFRKLALQEIFFINQEIVL